MTNPLLLALAAHLRLRTAFEPPCGKSSKVYGIDVRTILVELGKRRIVVGQEDMIVDVALDLAKARNATEDLWDGGSF